MKDPKIEKAMLEVNQITNLILKLLTNYKVPPEVGITALIASLFTAIANMGPDKEIIDGIKERFDNILELLTELNNKNESER